MADITQLLESEQETTGAGAVKAGCLGDLAQRLRGGIRAETVNDGQASSKGLDISIRGRSARLFHFDNIPKPKLKERR